MKPPQRRTCCVLYVVLWPFIFGSPSKGEDEVHPFFGVPASVLAQTDGFTSLFNGEDFDGWVNVNGAPETWSVEDGVVHCTGKPIAALRTRRQYENFILELEWRHLRESGNAGIFLWASPISAPGQPFLRAIEAQVLDHGYGKGKENASFTTHGDMFAIHGSTMEPHGRSRGMRSYPSEDRSKGSPEWNHYRIVAYNGVLRLSVNGQEVSGGSECNFRKGYIGLESEGSPVEFRNVRIIELPSTGVTPEMTAPEDAGWENLYNGVDWRGWSIEGGVEESPWSARGWQMGYKGERRKEPVPVLWSDARSSEHFEWIVDFVGPKEMKAGEAAAGLCFFGNPEPVVLVGGGEGPVVLGEDILKRGKWARVHCLVEGQRLRVHVEGREETVYETTLSGAGGGGPLLGIAGGAVSLTWANPYVRYLP
jgi:hypothetical protein